MARQRQKVIRNDGGVQVVEVLSGGASIPAATTTTIGGVKQAATQANSSATDVAGLVTDVNALLAKLKAAGIMA
ncbi:head fiber protein [Serratia fonticola]|uniref:head fiber protein n=1 Tax=Serratia fonticola TaxID=47917 RepID=UPI003AAE9304